MREVESAAPALRIADGVRARAADGTARVDLGGSGHCVLASFVVSRVFVRGLPRIGPSFGIGTFQSADLHCPQRPGFASVGVSRGVNIAPHRKHS
jgi:hypothetical protein